MFKDSLLTSFKVRNTGIAYRGNVPADRSSSLKVQYKIASVCSGKVICAAPPIPQEFRHCCP